MGASRDQSLRAPSNLYIYMYTHRQLYTYIHTRTYQIDNYIHTYIHIRAYQTVLWEPHVISLNERLAIIEVDEMRKV